MIQFAFFILLLLPSKVFAQSNQRMPIDNAIVTADDMDAFTEADRAEYHRYLTEQVRSCTTTQAEGTSESCPALHGFANGDPSMANVPYFRDIPVGTAPEGQTGPVFRQQVHVVTECNPADRKFYTRVTYLNRQGQRVSFSNPLRDPNNRQSNGHEMWLSSPGQFTPHPPIVYPTVLSPERRVTRWRTNFGGQQRVGDYLSEFHVVSQTALNNWAQARGETQACPPDARDENGECPRPAMPWTSWVQGTGGQAYHCSSKVDGYSASHGCIRLSCSNAMALFNLIRRVGTNNVRFDFRGYGACTITSDGQGRIYSDGGVPVAGAPTPPTPQQVQTRSSTGLRGALQRIDRFLGFGRQNQTAPQHRRSTDSLKK